MMMQQNKKKATPLQTCLIPLLGFIGFIALCFAFCEVVFLLGNTSASNNSSLLLLSFLG